MDAIHPPEIWTQLLINLSKYIDSKVSYTGRHSLQVAWWARLTAKRLQCSESDIRAAFWAALLHDIGKLGVPEDVLSKNGPLSDREWTIMRLHPIVGANIVNSLRSIAYAAPIIFAHQEKIDGSGYPSGLQGDEIPLAARILAVADAYEAMTSDRVYRQGRNHKEAARELRRASGTHFDARVVEAFLEVIDTETSPNFPAD
jgi:putative nucleotidyltransferase with HDIG domain